MKNLLYISFLFVFVGCKYENEDFKFHDVIYLETPFNKWIESKEEALDLKIVFSDEKLNQRNLDSLYQTTAQYIFSVWSEAKDCSAEIKNDTLYILYKDIIFPEIVEPLPIFICLEFNKIKYPNYKELKISYIQK